MSSLNRAGDLRHVTALRRVTALRYVTPLREGGSLPGLVEADDDGTYVMKFRGAGQGLPVLVAEVVVGELARQLGLAIPELTVAELPPELAQGEPDPEIQHLLRASIGTNLGMDFLPGAAAFDPLIHQPDPSWASTVLWLDAFVANVDRTWRNPNIIVWHGKPWLIDHGAALYFHHDWSRADSAATKPFDATNHVLRHAATNLAEADSQLRVEITPALLTLVVSMVPDEWLSKPHSDRQRYVEVLTRRLANPGWLPTVKPQS